MGPTWDPPGSYGPQMGPMLAPSTLLSGHNHCNRIQGDTEALAKTGPLCILTYTLFLNRIGGGRLDVQALSSYHSVKIGQSSTTEIGAVSVSDERDSVRCRLNGVNNSGNVSVFIVIIIW